MSQNPQPAARKQSALVKLKYDLLQDFDLILISDITIIFHILATASWPALPVVMSHLQSPFECQFVE